MAIAAAVEGAQRPLTPDELRRRFVPDQPVLLAGPPVAWEATGVLGWLADHGWSWTVAADPDRARWLASIQRVSAVLVAGPDRLVWTAVSAIRPATMAPMVVLGSASDQVVSLLEAGVDSVVDPARGPEELFARLVGVLRRSDHGWGPGARYLRSAALQVDLWSQECELDGVLLHLSPTEYSLLTFLMSHPQQALPAQTIVRRVWGWLPSDGKNTLRIMVNRLRRKLGDNPRSPRYIASIRGTGYRFVHAVVEMGDEADPLIERADPVPLFASIEQLAERLSGATDLAAAGDCLLDALEASGYADAMAVFRADDHHMHLVAARHMSDAWLQRVAGGVPLQPAFASAQSMLTREPVQLGDIQQMADHFSATAANLADAHYRACLFLPLVVGDWAWGHLGLVRRARQPFDPVGTAYLRAACAVFTVAVARLPALTPR